MINQSFQIHNFTDVAERVQQLLLENVKPCQYHNIDNVSTLISNNDNLFLFHLNIRSLQKHLDSLKELLHQLSTPPDVICITESKLKDGFSCSVSIPDYNFFCANSPTNAGGVAIYVNKDLDATLENDYQSQMVGCENLFLSLKIGNKKFIVGAVYKHPDANKILFLERLEEKLQLINLL